MCHPTVKAFYDGLVAASTGPTGEPTESDPWSVATLSPAWHRVLEPRVGLIQKAIAELAEPDLIAPQPSDIFNAIRACPDPATVQVIILGQDPYPTAGNAHGLSFSTRPSVTKIPASLQNIYKELASDLQVQAPTTGCLLSWAEQGVLLLNDVLTVTIGKPLSHAGQGWEALTAEMIAAVLRSASHVVLIAWGRPAQKKLEHPVVKPLLANHTVLTAPHPSPLSAYSGFFGSKPFSKTNAALVAHGQIPIEWV